MIKYSTAVPSTLAPLTKVINSLKAIHFKMKLEFMFMKHYAPYRCEPSIEALNFVGLVGWWGQGGCERNVGGRKDVNGEVSFL